jgi:hypothetical protein
MHIMDGNLSVAAGHGIDFSADANTAGMSSELLDDYEEGTWSPVLDGRSGGSYTMGGQTVGRYTKIGRVVTVNFTVHWTACATAYTGHCVITGLPFSSVGSRVAGTLSAINSGVSYASGSNMNLVIDPGNTDIYLIVNSPTGTGYSHAPTIASAGLIYACSIVYEAA